MEKVVSIGRKCLTVRVISCGAFLPGTLMAEDGWATLKGRFVYDGAPPAPEDLGTIAVIARAFK
jgi:hypothetical protein